MNTITLGLFFWIWSKNVDHMCPVVWRIQAYKTEHASIP